MNDPTSLAIAASAIGFVVNSGVLGWGIWSVRKIAKEEAEAVAKQISDRMREHDRDPQAHPNHHMTPVIHALQVDITRALARLEGKVESLGSEVTSLRKAHDGAVSRGLCMFQQDEGERKGR